MSLRVLFAVAIAVSLHAAPAASLCAEEPKTVEPTKSAVAPKSDQERITGWWREVSRTMAGKTTVRGQAGGGWLLSTYRFQDGKASEWIDGDDTAKDAPKDYKLVINDKTTPKQFDLVVEIDGETFVFPGIYEWDGDKLKFNGAMDSVGPVPEKNRAVEQRRPKNFRPSSPKTRFHNRLVILEKMPDK